MKSRFPWSIPLLYFSRVFFGLSRCCFPESRPVYWHLRFCQWALDERFTLALAISQFISRHGPTLPKSIFPRDGGSTHSIPWTKHVLLVFKDPHGLIWQMIFTMQKWFVIFNFWIHDRQSLAVLPLGEGNASSRLWFHAFCIRLQ